MSSTSDMGGSLPTKGFITSPSRGVTPQHNLAVAYPHIAQFWDSDKNPIPARQCAPSSNKKAWWLCDEGHSYAATPNDLTSKKRVGDTSGCPYCSGRKVFSGFNDLESQHPELVQQWDMKKNDRSPAEVVSGSSYRAWWLCNRGHSWQDSCNHRTTTPPRGCPYCAGKRVNHTNSFAQAYPGLVKQWDAKKNECSPDDVSHQSGKMVWWVCENGHSWEARVADRKRFGCPQCSHHISSKEQELVNYLSSLLPDGEEIITNSRSIIAPKELDIYIPSRRIAIEFNGIYWHTESQGKDRHYHQDKWRACKDKGIQLITVWEDQWRDSPEVVKSMLAHKLGASTGEHIYARNTIVKEVPLDHARNFCEAHHIQGFTQGSAYLGLYDHNDTLVAFSVWRKNGVRAYLERYCTSCIVVGGMGKLLAQGASWARLQGIQEIVTFSDHEVSNGGLYQKLGFTLDKELTPDYRYVVDGRRIHKFNYRLQRFRSDPNLEYHDGMTERELALLNRLERVWDCGKTRWVMEL